MPFDPWGWTHTITAARWLSDKNTSEVQRALVTRAIADVGIVETPWEYGGTPNRSGYIDSVLRDAGYPTELIEAGKGWWCAAVVGRWWRDVGLRVPKGYASCDNWLSWHDSRATIKWLDAAPSIGAAVLYGLPSLSGPVVYGGARYDATHIGIVARIMPGRTAAEQNILTIEGNAAFGGAFSSNGEAVVARKVACANPSILGYVPVSHAT